MNSGLQLAAIWLSFDPPSESIRISIIYTNVTERNLTKLCHLFGSDSHIWQDAQVSQRDRAAGCVIVFAKSGKLELGHNILRKL